jgi:hypothetical protein
MVITTATVRHGAIEIPGAELPEGTLVTVLAPDGDETFELSAEDEARLISAVQEADRGSFVPAAQLLGHLRRS